MIEKIIFKDKTINDCPDLNKIKKLKDQLILDNPLQRPTLEEALKIFKSIKQIGNETIDLNPFMKLLKEKLKKEPSSLGLLENILEIKNLFIKTEVTNLD